jgi:hypothetical protein
MFLDDHLNSLHSLNLGPIEVMPEYLEQYADNEETACATIVYKVCFSKIRISDGVK